MPDISQKDKKIKAGGQKILFKNPLFAIFIACFIALICVYSVLFLATIDTRFRNDRLHVRLKNFSTLMNSRFRDYAFRMRHRYYSFIASDDLKPKDIVLVTIDEESYKRFEKRWPWGRDVFADFLNRLSLYEPRVIALDFALYGDSPDNPEADIKLADAMERAGNVIIASVYGREKLYLGPNEIFARASAGYGVIGAIRDDDGLIRRFKTFALVLAPQKGGDISFEVKTAATYLGVSYDRIRRDGHSIMLESDGKRVVIPTNEDGDIWINYLSDSEDIKSIPIWRVMEDKLPIHTFKDKLVLVSQTGEIFHDLHPTPFGFRSGGLILTNSINSIVSQRYIKGVSPFVSTPVIIVLYLLAFLVFHRISPLKGFFILVLIVTSYLSISATMFLNGLMWPTFYVLVLLPFLFLGMTFYKYANMVFENAAIKKLAITDTLTGLYTHRYFRFLLEHTINKASTFGHKCSLIAIKVINFDRISKELSFSKGQEVQKSVSDLVKAKLPKNSSGAYLGMGEFGMLLPSVGMYESLGIAGSLRNRIKETDFGIKEEILTPMVAIGVSAIDSASFPKTGVELMRSARAAMARAKEIGYNKICRFNPKIDSAVFEPDVMEKEIRQRLDDEFGFLAIDLEERNKELEDLLHQLSVTQRDLEQAHFETLRALIVALEEKDPCTAGHSERVGVYAEKIGMKLKMPTEELKLLKQAGVLHDIGKVGMPQDILRKEDILSPSERHIVELHPEFSVRILQTSKYFKNIMPAIRDHHERLDGSGYPRGLKAGQISIEAQIIAVCDAYDAMTADRPYRKALAPSAALYELLSQPGKYNNNIVQMMREVVGAVKARS